MQNNHRREFLKKGLLGISGAALVPGLLKASETIRSSVSGIPELPGRIIGQDRH